MEDTSSDVDTEILYRSLLFEWAGFGDDIEHACGRLYLALVPSLKPEQLSVLVIIDPEKAQYYACIYVAALSNSNLTSVAYKCR
jgi:hypothetical protein